MTEANGSPPVIEADPDAPAGPVLVEFGRYNFWQNPDGMPVIARTTGTCERCQTCGCGEEQTPVTPATMLQMAMQQGITKGQILGGLGNLLKGGRRG